jgi:hypothetical protein
LGNGGLCSGLIVKSCSESMRASSGDSDSKRRRLREASDGCPLSSGWLLIDWGMDAVDVTRDDDGEVRDEEEAGFGIGGGRGPDGTRFAARGGRVGLELDGSGITSQRCCDWGRVSSGPCRPVID